MGLRLHSAKKYDIQYGEACAFNYCQEELNEIIDKLAQNDISYNDESLRFSNTVWANRKNLIENVDKIVTPDPEWDFQEEMDEYIDSLIKKNPDLSREIIHQRLKTIIEQSDPNCSDIYFSWF